MMSKDSDPYRRLLRVFRQRSQQAVVAGIHNGEESIIDVLHASAVLSPGLRVWFRV